MQNDSNSKQPTRNAKQTKLEDSSIFASRPRLAEREQMEARAASKRSGRRWLALGALAIVIVAALLASKQSVGLGLQSSDQFAGVAGANGAAESTPTENALPVFTSTTEATFTPNPTSTPLFGVGSSLIRPSDGMVMMYVPAGPFTMGTTVEEAMQECMKTRGECETAWFLDQAPAHIVQLDAYWMDQTEVTNAMYEVCVNAGVCDPPHMSNSNTVEDYFGNPAYADFPVVFITWKQAKNYCEWAGAYLPSEAQWEKAARGTDGRVFPWGNLRPTCSLANINPFNQASCRDDVGAVRYYADGQSPYLIYNMAGNAAEWVMDWYGENYYGNSPASNPQGPDAGLAKIMRGGSWYFDEDYARTTYRYKQDARYYYSFTGFRCAMSE